MNFKKCSTLAASFAAGVSCFVLALPTAAHAESPVASNGPTMTTTMVEGSSELLPALPSSYYTSSNYQDPVDVTVVEAACQDYSGNSSWDFQLGACAVSGTTDGQIDVSTYTAHAGALPDIDIWYNAIDRATNQVICHPCEMYITIVHDQPLKIIRINKQTIKLVNSNGYSVGNTPATFEVNNNGSVNYHLQRAAVLPLSSTDLHLSPDLAKLPTWELSYDAYLGDVQLNQHGIPIGGK